MTLAEFTWWVPPRQTNGQWFADDRCISAVAEVQLEAFAALVGPPGPAGPPGPSANFYADIEFIAAADGSQSVAVPTGRAALFIQGQRQPSFNFTIANGVLNIPPETGVMAGNFIIIEPK